MANGINQTVKVASGLNTLFGLWLLVASWVLGYAGTKAMWNDMIVGAVVATFAGMILANPTRYASLGWINVVLGVWLFIAPFVLQYGVNVVSGVNKALWNDIAVGIFIIVLSWLSATLVSRPGRG